MLEKIKQMWKTFYQKNKDVVDREVVVLIASWYPGSLIAGFITWNSHPEDNLLLFGLTHLFTSGAFLGGILLFAVVNAIVLYNKYFVGGNREGTKDSRNFSFSARGTYGTGGFMTKGEILTVLHEMKPENTEEIILGKDETNGEVFTIPESARMNRHIAVYGASGSGKTRTFVRPYALQAMKRGRRFVLSFPNAKTIWKAKNGATAYFEKNQIQYGERKNGDIVIPFSEKGKILTEEDNGSLVAELQDLGAAVKMEHGESMIFTDPKGELYETLAPLLKEEGYDVKILNIKDSEGMKHSDAWNCLAEIEGDDLNAQIFADTIIKNTSGSSNKQDFWSEGEMNLLKALCLYVERSKDIPTEMGEVYNLLTKRSAEELDMMFNALPYNDDNAAAKQAYSVYSQANDNVKGGMIIGLGSRLQVFQGQAVRNITAHNEIDLRAPGKHKCAYFCVTSDQQSAFDFLAALFYSMLFIKLVGFADNKGFSNGSARECWVPVNFVLDEFPNIAQITDFTKKISTVRSRAINISVIFQNLPQLQNRYPYGQWEEILGNCDTNLFLGCTDETTAEYISKKTDIATVAVSTHATEKHIGQVFDPWQYKQNDSDGKRAVLNPGEVLRLPPKDELIFLKGHKVIRCQKFDYSLHPDASRIKVCKIEDHTPLWKNAVDASPAANHIPIVEPLPTRQKSNKPDDTQPTEGQTAFKVNSYSKKQFSSMHEFPNTNKKTEFHFKK